MTSSDIGANIAGLACWLGGAQGFTVEEVEAHCEAVVDQFVHETNAASVAEHRACHLPSAQLRSRTPGELPRELLQAARLTAVRIFKVRQNLSLLTMEVRWCNDRA